MVELIVGEDDPVTGTKNTLRPLVEAEAIKVVEALLLGQSMVAARSDQLAPVVALLPEQLRRLPPIKVGTAEEERVMMELRDQVMRVTDLLSSSKGFDPSALTPFTEALRQSPSARSFIEAVVGGVVQRVTARVLKEVLQPPAGGAAAGQPVSAEAAAAAAAAAR